MPATPGLARKLSILWTLYFVQGLPYGFQATALPVYLRSEGIPLGAIGLATALAVPWMLKVFWSPLVDRYGSASFGRRKSWIVPLQGALALACAAAAFIPPSQGLATLLILVFLMNLFAATLDIAVDGLAVDLLERDELGQGNAAQVIGYKIGMLTGGGLLVWASGRIGWQGLFLAMAALVLLSLAVSTIWRENREGDAEATLRKHPTVWSVVGVLENTLRQPGALWILGFIATYKLGESMADAMFRPFVIDAGFTAEQAGLWIGTWGMFFSIAGSFAGGILATRIPLLHAVGWTAGLRAIAVALEWWLSIVEPTAGRVITVTCLESLFGGALTTSMFAWMMSRVDRRIGATHYTLFASIEVWGKLPAAAVSGLITEQTSYSTLFGIATVLSFAFMLMLVPVRSRE